MECVASGIFLPGEQRSHTSLPPARGAGASAEVEKVQYLVLTGGVCPQERVHFIDVLKYNGGIVTLVRILEVHYYT